MGIAPKNVVALGGVEIDFYVELVGIKSLSFRIAEIVLEAGPGWGGIERRTKQRLRYWINRLCNDVVGEWRIAVVGIIKLVRPVRYAFDRNRVIAEATRKPCRADVPKVALAFRGGEQTPLLSRGGMVETLPLVIEEEEQLVLDNGTTDGAAEHVPAQLVSPRSVEPVFP